MPANEFNQFIFHTTITFSVDDYKSPSAVTIEAPQELLNAIGYGGARNICYESLRSHYGNSEHGWELNLSPINGNSMLLDENNDAWTFETRKSWALLTKERKAKGK